MPLIEKELLERDVRRDIGAELLQSVREMNASEAGAVCQAERLPIVDARQRTELPQSNLRHRQLDVGVSLVPKRQLLL